MESKVHLLPEIISIFPNEIFVVIKTFGEKKKLRPNIHDL